MATYSGYVLPSPSHGAFDLTAAFETAKRSKISRKSPLKAAADAPSPPEAAAPASSPTPPPSRAREAAQATVAAAVQTVSDAVFNRRKTYRAIRAGELLPSEEVPGLDGLTAGELLVASMRQQHAARLSRSLARRASAPGPVKD